MDWQLGRVDHASLHAYRINRSIVILAGMAPLPTPGYEAMFRPYKMPHAYEFCWREKPGTWPDEVTPQMVTTRLCSEFGDVISVTDQTGRQLVTVEELRQAASAKTDGETNEQNRATGWSSHFDFGEAFRDAVQNLPPLKSGFDELIHFQIIESGGLYGGIVGAHDVYVTIERSLYRVPQPSAAEHAANR